jgi:uncharacterized protein (TIGR02597 family)
MFLDNRVDACPARKHAQKHLASDWPTFKLRAEFVAKADSHANPNGMKRKRISWPDGTYPFLQGLSKLSKLLPLAGLAFVVPNFALAAAQDATEVIGLHKLVLNSGANFISVPLHQKSAFRGPVQSSTANSVTFGGTPGWAIDQFGPSEGIKQYILIVRKDNSAGNSVEGDWWHITANTANQITVDAHGDNLTIHLSAGDELEVRRLTSVKDVFGFGASCRLNKDSDFDVLVAQEDVIRTVVGTSFSDEIFYHDGSMDTEGYYLNGNLIGSGDGSTITLNPTQPIMLFRKTGSATVTNVLKGTVQTTRLTQYLAPGANAFAIPFPLDAPILTSSLQESGWTSDLNFDILTSQEDIIRSVVGTSFTDEIFHYGGSDDVNGWYLNGSLNEGFSFGPTKGYVAFVKGPGPVVWRQAVPFDP